MDSHILRNPLLSVIANKEKWRQNVHQASDSFSEANFPKKKRRGSTNQELPLTERPSPTAYTEKTTFYAQALLSQIKLSLLKIYIARFTAKQENLVRIK